MLVGCHSQENRGQQSFSKNTKYLLAGKSANTGKIKRANECQMEIVNLRWLQELLLGQLTIKAIQKLNQLTKDSFKDATYVTYKATGSSAIVITKGNTYCYTGASHIVT